MRLTAGVGGGPLGARLNDSQQDHGEEHADLGLERVAEFGDEREEDGAGERLRLGDAAGHILQQAQAQVLLDGGHKLVQVTEHWAAILQQNFHQLQRQHLRQPTCHSRKAQRQIDTVMRNQTLIRHVRVT